MEPTIIYQDKRILVTRKPPGVLSTDEPGGMPSLLRELLREPQGCVRTVHRLDQVVGGLMVFARSAAASRALSGQIRDHTFQKAYYAVIHGVPAKPEGTFQDLLWRDRKTRRTRVAEEPGKDVHEASLDYQLLESGAELSLVEIILHTGRTHQIRVQFSHRGLPLAGDRKYGIDDGYAMALWSCHLGFFHPETEKWMEFHDDPPFLAPWDSFTWKGRNRTGPFP